MAYEKEGSDNKFRLQPDIVIEDENKIIIADTKWKILSEDKHQKNDRVSISDMYQLYAYGTKYRNCTSMFLIYPKDEDMKEISYSYFKKEEKNELELKVVFFDIVNIKNNTSFN